MLRFLSVPLLALALITGFGSISPRPALAEALFTAPVPDWVVPVAVPAADPVVQAAVTDGVLTLLSDEQVQWAGEERQIFTRTARLILDAAGLQAAGQVDMAFAPGSETMLLGRVTVTRAGQMLDMTDAAIAQTLDASESLARGAPEGMLAAEVKVADLQVGDVVEVAYLRRQLPVLDGINRAGTVRLEQDMPVVLAQVVVNWPESWPIYISGWPARVAFAQETLPGVIRHTWTRAGHIPAAPEPLVPPGYSDNTVIAYSAFPDWSAVTGALSNHYLGSYPLGAAWDTRLRAIQTEFGFAGDRVMAALRAVQNDLRTISGPMSADGWLAQLPVDVAAAGEGDAKAKALLLRTMLDKMGIEAYVALVNRTQGHDLNGQKPGFGAFDHAIVKVMVDDVPYWLDPSTSHEGGDFYSAVVPDFGYALPLTGADQDQLDAIDTAYTSAATTFVEESYDFGLLGAYLTVATNHYGLAANMQRQAHHDPDGAGGDTGSADVYAARYPGLRVLGPAEVTDDLFGNVFTVTERYLIPIPALNAMDSFVVQIDNPWAGLPDNPLAAGATARVAPMALGQPFAHTHRISLFNLPVPVQPPLGASIYGEMFNFAYSGYEVAPGEMALEWTFDQYQRDVAPAAVDQFLRDAAQINENTSFAFSLRP